MAKMSEKKFMCASNVVQKNHQLPCIKEILSAIVDSSKNLVWRMISQNGTVN